MDLIHSADRLPSLVNIVHPKPISWMAVFEGVNKHVATKPLQFISFDEWVGKVEALTHSAKPEDLAQVVSLS